MAFTGLHVACGISASDYFDTLTRQPIFGGVVWSQTIIGEGICFTEVSGDRPVVRFKASVDYWVSIAPENPNPNADPRILIEAGVTEDIACKPGDIIAGTPA